MERGVCRIHERLLFTGHSFGEDFQLENPKLRRDEHGAKSHGLLASEAQCTASVFVFLHHSQQSVGLSPWFTPGRDRLCYGSCRRSTSSAVLVCAMRLRHLQVYQSNRHSANGSISEGKPLQVLGDVEDEDEEDVLREERKRRLRAMRAAP